MTSVKSTYLLRELESGHALLDGLGEHGTKVTLRLRDTVDLSKQTVEDMKDMVILPECRVDYSEPGQPNKPIGFTSLSDALKVGILGDDKSDTVSLHPEVIIKTSHETNKHNETTLSGNYEFWISRSTAFFPGTRICNIATLRKSPAPGLYKGFECQILCPGLETVVRVKLRQFSVRGSHQFRTTVSRSGLEVDEGYRAVAQLCARLCFDHVRVEVERISTGPDAHFRKPPLRGVSRLPVAIGCRCNGPTSPARVRRRPAVDCPRGNRPKLSNAFSRQSFRTPVEAIFWTLESRSVDSLSLISRDLGSELSLNQFLSALAPDLKQFQYSPLLPEAHEHRDEVGKSHTPACGLAGNISRQQ